MRYLIAPDSFKGNMTAAQACETIAEGLRLPTLRRPWKRCPWPMGAREPPGP